LTYGRYNGKGITIKNEIKVRYRIPPPEKKYNIPKRDNYHIFLNIPNQEVQVRVHVENKHGLSRII